MSISLPPSYESHPTSHIKISHHPANTPSPTPVIIITLNRPEKRNAFTATMAEELEWAFTTLDRDPRVKVIILTGSGDTFCAGADLEIGFSVGEEGKKVNLGDYRDSGGRVALSIHRCRKPTIAAMQGSAVGVGMTMTLPAAIRIAHTTSKYGFVFGRRGITMESCSSYLLPRLIGYSRAMYLISTGAVLPPTSPHFGALFAETFPTKEGVVKRAVELASEMAQLVSPMAGALNRALMWRAPGSVEEAHLVESRVLGHMFASQDQKEGVGAFFEKRKPEFKCDLDVDGPDNYPWWGEVNIDPKKEVEKSRL
ncbi:hypothetical protein AbraIFM66950_002087 [Aspergillus brasiliensis]|nr:hypothetical protein AbraIFM66950_002087 [Aspergillus brasiliensis]